MSRVLVTGGAGYIGSHTCKALAAAGHEPMVYDNLSGGFKDFVRWGPLAIGDTRDADSLRDAFVRFRPDAVIHFAARIAVGESVKAPWLHYRDNVIGSLTLLDVMREQSVGRLVFSSSAAVYGLPDVTPVPEAARLAPISPYGRTKLMIETAIRDYVDAAAMRAISLRYFNAAGADASGDIGEAHEPETHLIPLAIAASASGAAPLTVFGDDYDTPDGTCIRDYVHVADLAQAHVLAVEATSGGPVSYRAFNVGTGCGYSVREILAVVERVAGRPVLARFGERRAGDPARLVSDSGAIREELGWEASWSDLDTIVDTAWRWHCSKAAIGVRP